MNDIGTQGEHEYREVTIDDAIREVVKDAIHEAHEEGVHHSSGGRGRMPGFFSLLLVVGGIVAMSYLMRNRSETIGETVDVVVERVQEMAEETTEQAEEMTEEAAERTDEMSEDIADRIDEGGSDAAERMEETADTE